MTRAQILDGLLADQQAVSDYEAECRVVAREELARLRAVAEAAREWRKAWSHAADCLCAGDAVVADASMRLTETSETLAAALDAGKEGT